MFTVVIGIGSALVFGSADFLGGMAAKRTSSIRVTAIASTVGFLVLLALLPLTGGAWSAKAVVLGAITGVLGAIAIALLYACLAIGPMSILSPLTAVVSAIVPVAIGLIGGDRLGVLGYLAIALALIAVVLVGFVREDHAVRPSLRGVLMAIVSGAAIGMFLVVIDQTPPDSGLVPLLVNRGVNSAVMFATIGVIALVTKLRRREPGALRPSVGWRTGLLLAIACGVADIVANVGLLLGLRLGELSVMAVLIALYPAGTIILASIVLKERIAIVQYIGLALAIAAGALLALDAPIA